MNYISHYNSPLGSITLASDGYALVGLWFDGQKHFGSTLGDEYEEKPLPVFDRTTAWLDIYFGGRIPDFTPKIALNDTNFRREVWDILSLINNNKRNNIYRLVFFIHLQYPEQFYLLQRQIFKIRVVFNDMLTK